VEQVMQQAAKEQLFQEYIGESQYRPVWKRIFASDASMNLPDIVF
jgi:hypothetical protein